MDPCDCAKGECVIYICCVSVYCCGFWDLFYWVIYFFIFQVEPATAVLPANAQIASVQLARKVSTFIM